MTLSDFWTDKRQIMTNFSLTLNGKNPLIYRRTGSAVYACIILPNSSECEDLGGNSQRVLPCVGCAAKHLVADSIKKWLIRLDITFFDDTKANNSHFLIKTWVIWAFYFWIKNRQKLRITLKKCNFLYQLLVY